MFSVLKLNVQHAFLKLCVRVTHIVRGPKVCMMAGRFSWANKGFSKTCH